MSAAEVVLIVLISGWALWANRDIHTQIVKKKSIARRKSGFWVRF